MQKGEEGVQIACKIAYVINGRPPMTDVEHLFCSISATMTSGVDKGFRKRGVGGSM